MQVKKTHTLISLFVYFYRRRKTQRETERERERERERLRVRVSIFICQATGPYKWGTITFVYINIICDTPLELFLSSLLFFYNQRMQMGNSDMITQWS